MLFTFIIDYDMLQLALVQLYSMRCIMKNITMFLCALCSMAFVASEAGSLGYGNPGISSFYTSLIDNSQNQTFESGLQAAVELTWPGLKSSYKLAKVHFIIDNSDKIGFDNIDQNFDHDNINRCKNLGF